MSFVWVVAITVFVLQMSVLFTTIYLHRSLTHRSLELHPGVAFAMHLELLLFTGLVPREWIAVHRKHHQFSDREGDPHSPYVFGLWKVLFGNYFYYRRETRNPATVRKYTPDYRPDLLDKLPLQGYGVFLGLGIFALLFGWQWGAAAWAAHIVLYVLLNATINSVCHKIGSRNFDNLATNLQWVALLTAGEGLHNNHHRYPTSARLSVTKREIDPAWGVIRLLCHFGLAKVKPLPEAKAA